MAQSRMAQSSVRLFSTGVPVSATRAVPGMARSALAADEAGFFTCWASSATTSPQVTPRSRVTPGTIDDAWSLRSVP